MGISPWHTGKTAPIWSITLTTDSGTGANLTGLTPSALQLLIKNRDRGDDIIQTGTGTFTIVQANPALVTYQLSSQDVTTPGNYEIYVIVTYSNGPESYGPALWSLLSL